jgi:hypothetical protein
MTVESQFLNKSRFTKLIEKTVGDLKISYMDAVLYVCDKNEIDPEDVSKLEAEAMNLNFLPKTNSLDSAFFE